MKEIVIEGRSLLLVDDTSRLTAAAALRDAGRAPEAELLLRSVGRDGAGASCERQPIRIVKGTITHWAPIRLVTAVRQEKGKVVEVVTEFEAISGVRWSAMNDAQRLTAERMVADIHAADVEVARSPESVRNQFWQTLPDGIDPATYAQTARDWLDAARRDVAELGRAMRT